MNAILNSVRLSSFFMVLLQISMCVNAENLSLTQALGYSSDTRLLIVHADDLGMSHSVNRASMAALLMNSQGQKSINSASIMVPCPWFPEIAAFYKLHPELDLGLHLTLTAEWLNYRWGGVLTDEAALSLHDEQNFQYRTVEKVVQRSDAGAVEREIRAQIERALAFGIKPTHLDSHMGTLFQTPEFFAAYLKMGREYGLPLLLPAESLKNAPDELRAQIRPQDVLIDRIVMATPDVPADKWAEYYSRVLKDLKPGVTEIIVHLGFDDAELQAITTEHPDYGAAWRQADYDFFTSARFSALLEEHKIQRVTWREIGALVSPD